MLARSLSWMWLVATVLPMVCSSAQVPNFPPDFPKLDTQDWPWWRGPSRDGVVRTDIAAPREWSAEKNIVWTSPIPGRGNGSPIVVNQQVILATCDEAVGSQSLLALDRQSGKQLWKTVVHSDGAMRKNNRSTGASATPACDGERIYINFANHDAIVTTALSLTGQQLWQTKVTDYQVHQGYGSSPALYGDLVLVSGDTKGGGAIAGLRRDNGKLVWKRERPSAPNYPSPIILKIDGRDQLLMTGCDLVTSLDPLTGNTFWEIEGATTECVTSTVTDGEHVFSSGGYPKNHMSAIRASLSLPEGKSRIAWENKERIYVPSLLIKDRYLFGVLDAGIAKCWEASTGKEMWKERLSGDFSASPVLVGDTIYATSESGETFLLTADPNGTKQLAKNKLGDEVFATPTFSRGQIFMRIANIVDNQRQEQLVCIGQ
jgi:outer membrane protein assembly factor BamB